MTAPVALHPEATQDPMTLRWVTDTSALTAPTPALTALLDDGTLAALDIEPGEVRTQLAQGQSWSEVGARVRSVLFQELSTANESQYDGIDAGNALHRRVVEVLRRDVDPFVSSHGGAIKVESLTDDGILTVSLGGTCGHCSLRTSTLRNVVANAVQTRLPEIRSVHAVRA